MLEARHLKKEYKTKNGPTVHALDDVSIKFENTGMVFILGKSGSGKSTLLNVLGGLDKYDEGEVIVKGKSSKDFSQADFDSYRNTFVGFIFQEYNILEEYSVSKNIALALELQGKKADKKAIEALMEQVDLIGYGNRKPNTLSGGQKQRVAIARALVKNPEIIMADEPTGALDSNTGKQVFDTLKKLSKDKLVLIVSHDRDFAEYYGDRVIELADGKIISDVSKYKSAPKASDGFEIVDNKVLTIKKGTKLDSKKVKALQEFIDSHDEEVIVSVDNKANDEFKKFAHIDSDGNKESFKSTDEISLPEYNPKDFKLIRSRLPNKDSLKLGASGLKSKPIRLVLTIILSAIAFGLFGLADTLGSYNKVENTIKSIADSNINYASFAKEVEIDHGKYTSTTNAKLSKQDMEYINSKLSGFNFIPVIQFGYGETSFQQNLYDTDNYPGFGTLYRPAIYGGIELTNENKDIIGTLTTGNIPAADDEIVITKYSADILKTTNYKPYDSSAKTDINDYNDLIGKKLYLNNKNYKIVGIIDTNVDLSRYSAMTEETFGSTLTDYMTIREIEDLLKTSYHALGYFHDGYLRSLISGDGTYSKVESISINGYLANSIQADKYGDNIQYFGKYDVSLNDNIAWIDAAKTSLGDNEIVLSSTWVNGLELEIDGVKISASNVLGGYFKDTLFENKFRNFLTNLGIDTNTIYSYELLNYYYNFDTSAYEYRNNGDDWFNPSTIDYATAFRFNMIDVGGTRYQISDFSASELSGSTYSPITHTFTANAHTFTFTDQWNGTDESSNHYSLYQNDSSSNVYNFDAFGVTYTVNLWTGEVIASNDDTHTYYLSSSYNIDTTPYNIDWSVGKVFQGTDEYTLHRIRTFNCDSLENPNIYSWDEYYYDITASKVYKSDFSVEYDVVSNKFYPSGIEYRITDTQIIYNSAQKNFINNHNGTDITAAQKTSIGTFLHDYENPPISSISELIQSSSIFTTLYNTRKTLSEEDTTYNWSQNDYIQALTYYIQDGRGMVDNWPCYNCAEFTADEIGFATYIKREIINQIKSYFPRKLFLRQDYDGEYVEYTVVGVHAGIVVPGDNYTKGVLATKLYYDNAKYMGGIYSFAIAPLDNKNSQQLRQVVEFNYADHGDGVSFNLKNTVMTTVDTVNDLIENLSKIFLYVGIGFAVFASLLLLNFITISISYKKREIGVLRAIGARGTDVFKIFFSESLIIALINFALAFGACFGVCIYLNNMLRTKYGILITLLNVGLRQVALMLAVSVVVAFISSFLPVFRIARKKPIDAIRNN